MNYWLDLFTGKTWQEFRAAGATVTGFNQRVRNYAKAIKKGDVLLCYLTGVKRWVGALEALGPSQNRATIWKDAEYPIRFDVRSMILLDPEFGIPMESLEGKLEFYAGPEHRAGFKGFVRRSPNLFRRSEDGDLILEMLRKAERSPVSRPVDPKKLRHRPLYSAEQRRGRSTVSTLVTVPEPDLPSDPDLDVATETGAQPTTRHTEVQFHLATLGAEMGLDIWIARNDRSRRWKGKTLGALKNVIDHLPVQFNEATHRTIELIDVLWLKGNAILAAFEVECTTAIYSGLLRMSDLLALQPNLDIKLYLVAPDERRERVEAEILRPIFKLRDKPLANVCGFLPFSRLMQKVEGALEVGFASSLRPAFLERTAEYFGDTKISYRKPLQVSFEH